MPKSSDQKLKLLYIVKILNEQTDEEHPMPTKVLIDELAKYGITAERKSIYSDISLLAKFGYNIIYIKGKRGGGYFLAEREFELPELKLLVDAVQSSKFITAKKSRELIEKLERLAGQYDARQLRRQVYVAGRIKAENESIYYNIDHIHRAIQENVQISFQYLDWTPEKKLKLRKEGVKYCISPWALTWQDENYYLIAYDKYADKIKHYRVDKMGGIELLSGEPREGISSFGRFDIGAYTNKTFGMFSGEEVTVTLQMPDRLLGVVIDRFGKDVDLKKTKKTIFSVRVKVAVSEQFFGWVTGLGADVRLLSPKSVVVRYEEYLKKIIEQYER